MDRKNIIIVTRHGEIEAWGSFKEVCDTHNLPYHSLKSSTFPKIHKDFVIHKVPFRTQTIIEDKAEL